MGILLIAVGIMLAAFVYMSYLREMNFVDMHMQETGSCFLADGTCLHAEVNSPFYMAGWSVSVALVIMGVYIGFIDNTHKLLQDHQIKISKALEKSAEQDTKKESFNAFLSVFNDDEKKVLKAIEEQENGIKQSTLRFRTDMSKASLSLMLKNFESKGIISRKEEGKTNRVFFVKKF